MLSEQKACALLCTLRYEVCQEQLTEANSNAVKLQSDATFLQETLEKCKADMELLVNSKVSTLYAILYFCSLEDCSVYCHMGVGMCALKKCKHAHVHL